MAHRFRLAVSYRKRICLFVRPPKPKWLENRKHSTRNQCHSFEYWTKIYWATPPWLSEEQIDEMRDIYFSAKEGEHVDHIVPLTNSLVCGLHVPWNLRVICEKANLHKSNNHWPDMPFENLDLFEGLESNA